MKNPIDKVINPENSEAKMTSAEAAAYIGITEGTLRGWRCSGKVNIPFYRKGGEIKGKIEYKKTDLDNWLESRRVAA